MLTLPEVISQIRATRDELSALLEFLEGSSARPGKEIKRASIAGKNHWTQTPAGKKKLAEIRKERAIAKRAAKKANKANKAAP